MERTALYYLIWTVVFGVSLAIGGSALEIVRLPFLNITLASFWVIIVVTLNKVILAHRFSVTHLYVVASFLAIFTVYLGPPSPLKPLLIVAGLSFDLATRLRTTDIGLYDLLLGHFALTLTGFFLVWVIFRVHTPALATTLIPIFLFGALVHFILSVILTTIIFRMLPPNDLPADVQRIRDQVGRK